MITVSSNSNSTSDKSFINESVSFSLIEDVSVPESLVYPESGLFVFVWNRVIRACVWALHCVWDIYYVWINKFLNIFNYNVSVVPLQQVMS